MSSKTEFNVTFRREEFKRLLLNVLNTPHKELLAETLTGILSQEDWQASQVVLALNGVGPVVPVKVGDKLWVKVRAISSWQFDKEKMKEEKMIVKDQILAEVVEVDYYRQQQIHLKYEYIDWNGQIQSYEDWTTLQYVSGGSDVMDDLPL